MDCALSRTQLLCDQCPSCRPERTIEFSVCVYISGANCWHAPDRDRADQPNARLWPVVYGLVRPNNRAAWAVNIPSVSRQQSGPVCLFLFLGIKLQSSMPRKRGGADAAAEAETKKAKGGLAVGDDLPEFEVETDEGETVKSTVGCTEKTSSGGYGPLRWVTYVWVGRAR